MSVMRRSVLPGLLKWIVAITVGLASTAIMLGVLWLMGSELTPSAVLAIVFTLETARLWDMPPSSPFHQSEDGE